MEKPATPLPWRLGAHNCLCDHSEPIEVLGADNDAVCCNTSYYPTAVKPDDARFIVHACNAYPRLTAINAELVEALERIEQKAFPDLSSAHVYLDTIRAIARAALRFCAQKGMNRE